jgi:Tol biopolymer transport system component
MRTHTHTPFLRGLVGLASALLLAACGGGGGGEGGGAASSTVYLVNDEGVFAAADEGSNMRRLTPAPGATDDYREVILSPDRRWAAIVARLNGETRDALYLARTDGQAFVNASALVRANNEVFGSPVWSPTGNRLVYLADDAQDDRYEVFMIEIDAGGNVAAPRRVNGTLGSTGNVTVRDPRWSYDGSYLAYKVSSVSPARTTAINTHRTGSVVGDPDFSVRVTEGGSGRSVGARYAWSPAANRLAYSGQVRSAITELFWVDAGESSADYTPDQRVLNSTLASGRFVDTFAWSDSGRYLAWAFAVTGDYLGLNVYDFNISGPNSRRLADLDGGLLDLRWLPGRERIAVVRDANAGGGVDARLRRIGGDGSLPLQSPASGTSSLQFRISRDGGRIASITGNQTLTIQATESSAAQVDEPFTTSSSVFFAATDTGAWSPDGRAVLVLARPDGSSNRALRSVSVTGTVTPLSDGSEGVTTAEWAPNGARVCYQTTAGASTEVYCVRPDGTGAVRLTADTSVPTRLIGY